MARVFVTRKIPYWEEMSKPLYEAGHEIVVSEQNSVIERTELMKRLGEGFDGLLCLLTDRIDAEVLASDVNKKLKIVANYAVGFDNVDVDACKARNIWVTNTPSDKVNESVAEHTWALTLALSRRVVEAHEFMRNAAYRGWEPGIFVGSDLVGKTFGIVGMGRIGGMVARRAQGFGMRVLYYNRKRVDEVVEKEAGVEYRENLDALLAECDVVSLHVPLTKETRHLINGKNLATFKKGAVLVNTARGPVVDEEEVVEALRAGMLSGYGVDVYENEPNPNPEMLGLSNVVMTPHIASATVAARKDMAKIVIENVLAAMSGTVPPNNVVR